MPSEFVQCGSVAVPCRSPSFPLTVVQLLLDVIVGNEARRGEFAGRLVDGANLLWILTRTPA